MPYTESESTLVQKIASHAKIAGAAADVMQNQLQRIAELEADCRHLRDEHVALATAVSEYFGAVLGVNAAVGYGGTVRTAREALQAKAREALAKYFAGTHTGSDRN